MLIVTHISTSDLINLCVVFPWTLYPVGDLGKKKSPEFLRRYPVSEEPRYVEVLQNPLNKYRINAHESLSLSGLAPVTPLDLPKTNIYVNMLDFLPADDDYVYIDDFEE
ncbi:hypothetical protein FSP39_011733 [Pinctada imbricata]|uniref:Uncharacterized protein n=1 Tax=Pinctada imbricata TaxID=66713 RepID=A0AA88YCI9_PINIB|nr:hypothetical protein FSP39_011733 [Pinctada imbricata]